MLGFEGRTEEGAFDGAKIGRAITLHFAVP